MIFRRYGTSYESVDIDFDATAFTEIGFRKNRERAVPVEDFRAAYATAETVELVAEAEGLVQQEVEQLMLDRLRAQLEEMRARLSDGEVLVIENDRGRDQAKTRQSSRKVLEDGEYRLHFESTVDPGLRVSVRRPGA